MAKSLIKFCGLMKNVSTISKCTSTMRFCYCTSVKLKEISTKLKEVNSDLKLEECTNDTKIVEPTGRQLFELLSDDSNLSSLMENLEANKSKIDCRHAVVALTTMYKYFKKNEVPTAEVHSNEHFLRMCSILSHHLTSMQLSQIVQSLKILNLLEVSSSSMIIQSLLQLVRHSINDLTLQQIYYLSYFFKLLKPTPLSTAISDSLPTIFMSQVDLKLDKDNIKELETALRYVSTNKTSKKTIQYILDSLNDNIDPVDSNSAMSIMLSLLKIKNVSTSYHDTLYRMKNIILNESGDLQQQLVLSTLLEMCKQIIVGNEEFYDEEFLDKLIDRIIAENYGFEKGVFVLNLLNKFNYIHIPLLKYLSQLCSDDPSILSKCVPVAIVSLSTGLALANFTPPNWNELQEIIENNYNRISDDSTLSFLAIRLVSLGCFNTKLINYVFSIIQNRELMSYQYQQAIKRLYVIVKILHPTYSGKLPSQTLIDSFPRMETEKSGYNPLLPALIKILKDPSFIKKNLKTHYGHDIDYLIVMKNGFPVIVHPNNDDSTTYVEDFNIPTDSEKIALLYLPNKAYGKNIPILEASFVGYIKSLEALSFTVAPISERSWLTMHDFEKLPYLKQLIKLSS